MNVYIDLGAFRGLYIKRFRNSKMYQPGSKIYAFECNPYLRNFNYGSDVTTIHKAAWISNGELKFYISKKHPSVVQGSSVYKEKRTGNLDKEHPRTIPCIDFPQWIRDRFKKEDTIIIKSNIEGAEYDILEKMIEDGTIEYINILFCQFHWERIGISKERHIKLVSKLNKLPLKFYSGYGNFMKAIP